MKIKSIRLENFRNFEDLQTDFDDVNIIWGENAQGKTNLLEAIYLFTGAKSFRGARDKEMIRLGEKQSRLTLYFEDGGREQEAQLKLENRRSITLNGVAKKNTQELSELLKAVVFSPVHLSMIKDGPKERRQFIDGALCQLKANYRKLLREYDRALLQRNALLKDMFKHPEMEQMLYLWDENLVKHGAKMIYQRLKYIESLTPYVNEVFSGISRRQETVTLTYAGSAAYEPDIPAIEKELKAALQAARVNDLINRTTTVGPHRDDIDIRINGHSARVYGSQGQQRSCVLALKLAEAALLRQMTGREPIALLDDVMSELDESRQDYILNHIESTQVFITCCDKASVLRLKQGKTIRIRNGTAAE